MKNLTLIVSITAVSVLLMGCPTSKTARRIAATIPEPPEPLIQVWEGSFLPALRSGDAQSQAAASARLLAWDLEEAAIAYVTLHNAPPTSTADLIGLLMHGVVGANGSNLALLTERDALPGEGVRLHWTDAGIEVLVPYREDDGSVGEQRGMANWTKKLQDQGSFPQNSEMTQEQRIQDVRRRLFFGSIQRLYMLYGQVYGEVETPVREMLTRVGMEPAGYRLGACDDPRQFGEAEYRLEVSQDGDTIRLAFSDLLPDADGDGWPDADYVGLQHKFDYLNVGMAFRLLGSNELPSPSVWQGRAVGCARLLSAVSLTNAETTSRADARSQ